MRRTGRKRIAFSALCACTIAMGAVTAQSDWQPLAPRHHHTGESAMVYDAARERLVLVAPGDGTWTWDGNRWRRQRTSRLPAKRSFFSLGYDPGRQRVVLFGGTIGSYLQDTWEYDGHDWSQRQPARAPSARMGAAMAFNHANNQLILFGGYGMRHMDEPWVWDGRNWVQLKPSTSPTARISTALASAPGGGVLMFGGENYGGPQGDTWFWTGTTWIQLFPSNSPPVRSRHHLIARPRAGYVELYGGHSLNGQPADRHLWRWQNGNWHRFVVTPAGPPNRWDSAGALDRKRGEFVIRGGTDSIFILRDQWAWSGSGWRLQRSAPLETDTAVTLDTFRHRVVSSGGYLDRGSHRQPINTDVTWEWTANGWARRTGSFPPPPGVCEAIAYDPHRRRVVRFGGNPVRSPGQRHNQTWEWDGTRWSLRAPTTSPPVAQSVDRMAYDPVRRRMILTRLRGTSSGEAWSYDGSAWQRLTQPVPVFTDLAFDGSRQQIAGIHNFHRTLHHLGPNGWVRSPMQCPPRAYKLFFHSGRNRLVAFSQSTGADPAWELTPSGWARLPSLDGPRGTVIYDPRFDRVLDIAAGVVSVAGPFASSRTFGVGCGAPAPTLRTEPAGIGRAGFSYELHAARPRAPSVLGISLTRGAQPIGPCTLYLRGPTAWLTGTTNATGFYESPSLPTPIWRGPTLTAQAFVLDPAVPVAGFSASTGVSLQPGF